MDRQNIPRKYKSDLVHWGYGMPTTNFKERHGLARLILLERNLDKDSRHKWSSLGLPGSDAPNEIDLIENEVRNVDFREEQERYF